MKLWRAILCAVGLHDWADSVVILEHGYRAGKRCQRCKTWHRSTAPIPFDDPRNLLADHEDC